LNTQSRPELTEHCSHRDADEWPLRATSWP
jgi:hypothetical protein